MPSSKKWYRGHIGRFWTEDYKNLEYTRQPITQEEIDEWVKKGYDYVKSYTGKMYDNRNPMPEWIDQLKKLFDFKNISCTFYKMDTLEIMPEHSDHFRTYMKIYNAKFENVYRILVMLEDWKPGHYLEIDGLGIVNWVAGDYFVWENSTPHAASNIGTEPRYSLQLTGELIQSDDVWHKLHWYNIPKLESKPASLKANFMFHILEKCFHNNDKPFYIYMYNQRIRELESIIHDEETIEYLNNVGIDIYLYEPLCSYLDGAPIIDYFLNTKHTRTFYSEFYGNEDSNQLRADELDSILEYVQKNNLTNVRVHACDYNLEKNYPYYSPYMQLLGDDLYIKTALPIKVENEKVEPNFTKKFISANWRYTPHRHLIAAAVAPLSSYISWYYKAEFFTVAESPWHNFHKWKENKNSIEHFNRMITGIQHLNRYAPFNLDLDIKESILVKDSYNVTHFPDSVLYSHKSETIDGSNNALEKIYSDIFCDVVTESRYAQPTANFSEKVYQPMWYKKPYILVAPPYTLKVLKEQGFKTFSDYWDESYDNEEIHEKRMFKIFDTIDFINSKSIDELRIMYEEMKPIINHNYNLLCERLIKQLP
jgi:hypothetical protein